jgi:hypothetical protein
MNRAIAIAPAQMHAVEAGVAREQLAKFGRCRESEVAAAGAERNSPGLGALIADQEIDPPVAEDGTAAATTALASPDQRVSHQLRADHFVLRRYRTFRQRQLQKGHGLQHAVYQRIMTDENITSAYLGAVHR